MIQLRGLFTDLAGFGIVAAVLGVTGVAAYAQPVLLPTAPNGVTTFNRDGIQFSHVHAANIVGGTPAPGPLNGPVGGGSWDFGIARTELTQGQWVEFINAFNAVPIPENQPYSSGLQTLLTGTFGVGPGMGFTELGPLGRGVWQTTPEGAVRPVWQIGWFGAALYCNWLSNGRQTTIDSLLTGSYDLHQFDALAPQTWPTVTRAANAQYFIPTYDEWAVASFYDANRFGPGVGGWWSHLNGRERPGIGGAPGTGETSFLWDPTADGLPAMSDLLLPVGSYPGSQSPWGLLDTSGSLQEVLDDVRGDGRLWAGTMSGWSVSPEAAALGEQLGRPGWEGPIGGGPIGFRIAVSIPSPPVAALFALAIPFRRSSRR